MNVRHIGFSMLFTATAAGLAACSSDSSESPAPAPMTEVDSGVVTTPDTGMIVTPPDAGFQTEPDAGHYCAVGDEVTVDGMGVPVDTAETRATTESGFASLLCIDDAPPTDPTFIDNYCIKQCLDFLGYAPTAQEVADLEFDAFPVEADPSYDYDTYANRAPGARLDIGFRTLQVPNTECDSGFKLEMGFQSLGPSTFETESLYTIRARSAQGAAGPFATTYLYRYVLRNDQSPNPIECGLDEERVPRRNITFPVVPATVVARGVQGAGGNIPGSADLTDGRGTGYAMVEVRDCAGGIGSRLINATAGTLPAPTAGLYPGADLTIGTERATTGSGLYYAVGFPGMTATSSNAITVRTGVGLNRNAMTCTEEFGGLVMPIFADGVTFVRMNRETVVHGQ